MRRCTAFDQSILVGAGSLSSPLVSSGFLSGSFLRLLILFYYYYYVCLFSLLLWRAKRKDLKSCLNKRTIFAANMMFPLRICSVLDTLLSLNWALCFYAIGYFSCMLLLFQFLSQRKHWLFFRGSTTHTVIHA